MHIEEPLMSWLMLMARICLAAVFAVSGVHKALYFRKAQAEFRDAAIPVVGLTLPLTIILHLLAPVFLVSGVFATEAALALAVFTIAATIKVHHFWTLRGEERLQQSRIALAHLALVGGLIMLAAVGPGRLIL